MIAATSTFTLGRYTVQVRPRIDSPAWAQYVIFLGERLIGKQFSHPSLSDCQWLKAQLESARRASLEEKRHRYGREKLFAVRVCSSCGSPFRMRFNNGAATVYCVPCRETRA